MSEVVIPEDTHFQSRLGTLEDELRHVLERVVALENAVANLQQTVNQILNP